MFTLYKLDLTATRKKYNLLRRDLIRQLYLNQLLTLPDLSRLTAKSLPLVTATVNDLLQEGYILESGLAPSTGGRRASTFLLNKDKQKYIVAVAMDQLVTRAVIYNLHNEIKVEEEAIELPLSDDPVLKTLLINFLRDYIDKSGLPKNQILGIGIGMPGFVNSERGINHTFFQLKGNQSLTEFLGRELGLPVFIDNDSSLIALAELRLGAGRATKDLLVINIGWGIGLGMAVNGRMFRGHSGYAGEFSHIPISSNNKICSCGKRGCLEVDTSLLVLVEKAKAEIAKGVSSRLETMFADKTKSSGDQFLEAAKAGDPLAVSILSEAGLLIGKGIATLIHIMNPEVIVLGGRGAVAGKILMAPIQQSINEYCIPRLAEQTTIKVSELALKSELLGAAILVIENCQFN